MGWLTVAVTAVKTAMLWTGDHLLGHSSNKADNKEYIIKTYMDYYNLPEQAEDPMRDISDKFEKVTDIRSMLKDVQV